MQALAKFSESITQRLSAGEKPADVWPDLPRHAEKLEPAELASQLSELDALADLFPDEVRWVDSGSYAKMTEVDTGSREGPDWKFEGFLAQPKPVFRFARMASYDLDNRVKPWLNFVGRQQIRHWYFDNLRSQSVAELAQIFTEDYFRNSSGATLRWIDGENEEFRNLFSQTDLWKHWKTLRFEWLRSDDKTSFARWFDLMAGSSIRNFSLQSCDPGEAGFRALADSPVMTQLEELGLMNVVLGPAECEILLAGKYQPRRLKKLKLDDSSLSNGRPEMDAPCFVKLIQSPFFSCLEDLENHYHEISATGIAALVQSPARATLKYLSLHNSRLKDEGLKMIFDNAWPSLKGVYISYDQFSPELMKTLRQTRLYAQCKQVSIFPMDGESIYKEKEIAQG